MPGTLRSSPAGNGPGGAPRARKGDVADRRPGMGDQASGVPAGGRDDRDTADAEQHGSPAGCGGARPFLGTATALVEVDQPPQGRHADDRGHQAGQRVHGSYDGPAQRGVQGDTDQHDQQPRAVAEGSVREHPGQAGQQEHPDQHRADEDRLVMGAEVGDRPVLHRRGRVVDDGLADREDRGGLGAGHRGHEVSDGHAREGGEDTEQGVAEFGQHTEWFVAAALRDCAAACAARMGGCAT